MASPPPNHAHRIKGESPHSHTHLLLPPSSQLLISPKAPPTAHPPQSPVSVSDKSRSVSTSPPFMALVSDSSHQNPSGEDEELAEAGHGRPFDMVSLKAHLPQKRKGLSMYFSGKSRSFSCMGDAKCVGDLEKPVPEIPEAKRRKYTQRRAARVLDLVPWSAASGASSCSPCVGV